jgi:hypothetical protein
MRRREIAAEPDTVSRPAIKIIALSVRASPLVYFLISVYVYCRVCILLILTRGLVVVDIDALQLQIRGATVVAQGVDSMLVGDDLPELPTRKFQSLQRSFGLVLQHSAFCRILGVFSANSLPD